MVKDEQGAQAEARVEVTLGVVMADRKVKGKELARRVGMTPVMISRIRTGAVKEMRLSTLAALCDALSCQPGDLLRLRRPDPADSAPRPSARS